MINTGGGRFAALTALLGVASLVGASGESLAAPAQVRLRGHIPQAAVAQAQLVSRVSSTEKISLALTLPLRDSVGLDTLLGRVYDPKDSLYRHYLTSEEFTRRFSPTEQSYQAVAAFARARGLAVTGTHSNRLLLDVTGTASTVESAFGLHLMRYRAHSGRFFRAPDADPLVTSAVSGQISGIVGLSDLVKLVPHSHRKSSAQMKTASQTVPGIQSLLLPAAQPSEVGSGVDGGLTPSDIKTAYNLNGVPQNGAGRTLALFELDGYTPSDVTAYENAFNLPPVPLLNILIDQFSGAPGDGAGEVTLDIELMVALAPGASKILVYEGPNSGQGLLDTYDRIATDNAAKEISSSWGIPETLAGSELVMAENTIFKQMAIQGQSIYAASGDSGAYADGTTVGTDDPASQPYMVGVGGTLLSVSGRGGPYASESAWGDPLSAGPNNPHGTGGGGGVSSNWPLPDYQAGVGGLASTTNRNVPDISLDADPNTGYSIYFENGWTIFGGTSCAAPLWAAYTALVNQKRASNSEPSLGFPNPLLYQIAATPDYNSAFHDVLDGTSNLLPAYATKPGYDNSTGLGTFNGANLLNLLAPVTASVVSLVFTPNPAYSAHKVSATVTIDRPAGAGGVIVNFSSDDIATLPVIPALTIPAGASSATFTSTAAAVTSNKIVTVTASTTNGTPRQSRLTVNTVPALILPSTLTLNAASVYSGTPATGTITLNGPAPGAGLTLILLSSDPSAVVPPSITIPKDGVSATFQIGTQTVLHDVSVTVSASANGASLTAPLTVTAPAVMSAVLAPSTVTGGTVAPGTLTLNGPAPVGGITIVLTSSNPIATPSPASLVIPAGSTSGVFNVNTTVVSALTTATITAAYNGLTNTALLTVQAGGLAALSIAPAGVISGGAVIGTVTLDSPAAAGGATIVLSSSNPAATTPVSILVPQGATTATFPVTTLSVAAPVTAIISGSLNGLAQTASLAVTPIRVKTLTLSPTTAAVGGAVTGTITLTVPALTGGVSVALVSSSVAAAVPATVVVAQGATTATFPVTTVQGGGVTITATTGGQSQSVGLTVLNSPGTTFPAGLNLLSVPYDYSGQPLDSLFGFAGVKLAVWQPLLSQYAVTPNAPADALRPGVGYWIKLPTAITLTRAGVPTNRTTDFNIALSAGWNQIGDPFPVSVRRSGLQINAGGSVTSFVQAATATVPIVSDLIYSYTPGVGGAAGNYVSVGDGDSLQPGLGYWVYAYQAVTLIVPHTGS